MLRYNTILLESIHCTESPSNAPQAWFFNCTLTGFKKGSFVAQFFMRFLHSVTNCLATKQPNRALRNIPMKTQLFTQWVAFCQNKHIRQWIGWYLQRFCSTSDNNHFLQDRYFIKTQEPTHFNIYCYKSCSHKIRTNNRIFNIRAWGRLC